MNIRISTTIMGDILQRMQYGEDFTSLDVSTALKLENEEIRYKEVAETVREMFASGVMASFGYGRRLTDVAGENGQTIQVYQYFHTRVRILCCCKRREIPNSACGSYAMTT